jgi:hypothetical protein
MTSTGRPRTKSTITRRVKYLIPRLLQAVGAVTMVAACFMVFLTVLRANCLGRSEIATIRATEIDAEAVLVGVSAGAATSAAYEIYVQPQGDPGRRKLALRAFRLEDVELTWVQKNVLLVETSNAFHVQYIDSKITLPSTAPDAVVIALSMLRSVPSEGLQ